MGSNGKDTSAMKQQLQLRMKDLTEAFALFDADRSGVITVEELGKLLESLGQDLSEEEVMELVLEVDSNKTGSVEFQEFVRVIDGAGKRGASWHMELQDTFRRYDKSGDGRISVDELHEHLRTSGVDLSEKEVEAAIKAADADADGNINYSEFLKLLSVTRKSDS